MSNCLKDLKSSLKKGAARMVGTRRLKKKLAEPGFFVSRRRIGRLMNQAGLWCKTKKLLKPRQTPNIANPLRL